jgi:hypothetical protein
MVMPGDNISLEVTLHTPVAMEKGLRFAIREGGKTVGAGNNHGDHQIVKTNEGCRCIRQPLQTDL